MPADVRKFKVEFNKETNEWELGTEKGKLEGPSNYPQIDVPKDHVGVYTFQITGTGKAKFHPTEPFIAKGSSNPTDFGHQFVVLDGWGEKKLMVLDQNSSRTGGPYPGGTYTYALQFDDGSKLDPIVTNGGCCQSKANPVHYAMGGAALLALAVLIAWPLIARRRARAASKAGPGGR